MKFLSEKTYHNLFRVGIVAKIIFSTGETIAGLAFAFLNYDTLHQIAFFLFGGELMESPRDIVWDYVYRGLQSFSATPQSVWAFIFLSHGIVKLLLLAGLWRNKLWAYPTSATVFTFFIVYQLYQLAFTPSIILWFITILDVAVVILVLHEYRHRRTSLRAT